MNRYEAILKSIEIVSAQIYSHATRVKPDTGIIENLKSQLDTLIRAITKHGSSETLKSIGECCIPCSIFASKSGVRTGLDGTKEKLSGINCCGVLYADDCGNIKCNKCGRGFEVKITI